MKRTLTLILTVLMLCTLLFGCGQKSGDGNPQDTNTEPALADGVYTADFSTDSSMFHANEACNGMGTLTVENGQMTFHVSLASKKIVNLYVGMAADAEANKADWLLPTTDTVTYSDGTSEEVYGYDIPVAAVNQDFQLALLGTKGKWYDHTVSIRNAQPKAEEAAETPADGEYSVNVTLEGGSGRATVESPAALTVADGKMTAVILWSSPNYDYMVVDGEKYLPVNTEGNSVFELPVTAFDKEVPVTADTTAMSVPHEIEYTILLDSASIANAGKKPMEVIAVVYVAAVIAVSITAWQIHRKRKGKKE